VLDKKRATIDEENNTKEESSERLTESTTSMMNDITTIEVNEIGDKTDVQKVATLTAKLTHLIS
jgi:putative Ca2+/H+ antiporter (TMEM165/GDT1 family)